MEINRDAMIEAFHRQDQQTGQEKDDRLRSMETEYQNQIVQLHVMLNAESERLSDAREQMYALSEARKNDLLSLKGKLHELVKNMDQKERDYQLTIQGLRDQVSLKDEEYKSQMRAMKSSQLIDIDQLQSRLRQSEDKLHISEKTLRELELDFKRREASAHELIQSLQKESLDVHQLSSQRESEWKFWGQKCHKMETENAILRNELNLLENEDRRRRELISQYEIEITRLDNIVYGGKSTKPAKNLSSYQFRYT